MTAKFILFLEGSNGKHIEMPIEAKDLEELDRIIASKWPSSEELKKAILKYNNGRYLTPYPHIKMIVKDKKQHTEIYEPIYEPINQKEIIQITKEIINSNLKERYSNNYSKQYTAKELIHIVSKDKEEISYVTVRKLYHELKKLNELKINNIIKEDNTLKEELDFNKEKYQTLIKGFEGKALICINRSEFPYVHSLKEKLKQIINQKNIHNEDIILADDIVSEIMEHCKWMNNPPKKSRR